MRFAGELSYPASNNEEIRKALEDFTNKVIEAIPTQDALPWELRLIFEAETRPGADFEATIFSGKP